MATKRLYSHDHSILLLSIVNIFLGIATILVITIRLVSQNHSSYFVQYRPTLGLNSFQTGSLSDILSFILLALLVLVFSLFMSYKVYNINRNFSLTILNSGVLLEVLILLVSNSLLGLH